jgi:hypothetical protein
MAEKRFLDSIHATRVESATNHDPASYAATMLLRPGLHLRKRPSVEELRARIKEFYEVLVAHPARP